LFGRLLLLFTLVPLVEVVLLIKLADRIDWLPTIALVIVTGIVGAALARREGFRLLQKIQADLAAGTMPADGMIDAMLVLAAGILLVTPGVITDAAGLILLMPPARAFVRRGARAWFAKHVVVMHHGGSSPFAGGGPHAGEADAPSPFGRTVKRVDAVVVDSKPAEPKPDAPRPGE
jgi:UPF0716 protein FxsA